MQCGYTKQSILALGQNGRTDMSDMLPAMTGAEMQTAREFLGLTRGWLASDLQMGERRMMRMEADQERIPDALVARLDEIAAITKDRVTQMIAKYRRLAKKYPDEDLFIRTYRTDDDYAAAEGYIGFPAKWHRMCCARVCEAVQGLGVTYRDLDDPYAQVVDTSVRPAVSATLFSGPKGPPSGIVA